jgi:excisionase family DNA binding protein
MLVIKEDAYYTIKELTDGFVVSRSSVYEMMQNKGLKYSRFGGKRLILGKELMAYLSENAEGGGV